MEKRRLVRSQTEKMLGGVCGGLAEFLDLDPTLVRLGFIALTLLGGHGILLYIIMLIIVPPASQALPPMNVSQ